MPSERTRNFIVGVTILIALGALMWGIFILGKFPTWGGTRPYTVTLFADNANGSVPGSKVDLNGVNVGQVTDVHLDLDKSGRLIAKITLQIDGHTSIPASAVAYLGRPTAGIGSTYVSIAAVDLKPPLLAKNGTATLAAVPADNSLIPAAITEDITTLQKNISGLTLQLTEVAKDLHGLLAYAPPELAEGTEHPGTNPATSPSENISTVVIRLNRTVASIQKLLGDPKLQQNIRTVVQNLADASSQLKGTMENLNSAIVTAKQTAGSFNAAATRASATLDTTQAQVLNISEHLVTLLDGLNKNINAIVQGDGTTGKLVNDPRLYDELVDLASNLKTTVNDLDFIVKKWKDEGVNLHLK
ncbi:MAG TPA: MlaD family protein [Phycisphaerae bacterium]|jgi:phospholipid/cholesterol/gamma-HCH transport system substrate-binding protein|nr:MlaD family protein [Phycisphaerae bacterium]